MKQFLSLVYNGFEEMIGKLRLKPEGIRFTCNNISYDGR